MKRFKRVFIIFLVFFMLSACSNDTKKETDKQSDNVREELKEVPEKSRERVNKVLLDYGSLIEEKFIFESSELQDHDEIMIVHYRDEKKEIELVFTLNIKYDGCTSIELYGYGYSSLEPPLKNKVEDNELTTIYYEKYFPLFKKLNFDEYFGVPYFEEIDGSGDENYRNGFVGYTTGINRHWIR